MDEATIERVLAVWAADAGALSDVLSVQDPSWGSESVNVAGGRLVLSGAGLYVNRAIGCGSGRPLSEDEWRIIESRSESVGVPPAIEIGPITHPDVPVAAAERGYAVSGTVQALARGLLDLDVIGRSDPAIVVESVEVDRLGEWQEIAAAGWGHAATAARRASDAYAAAAFGVQGQQMLIAHAVDGRPLGCAGVTVRDGVATLGAMSTLPTERGQGVQAALIAHRLESARASGCDIATTTAAPNGDSQRNLVRRGFVPWFQLETWTRGVDLGR